MWEQLGSENWIQVLEPDRELRASALARILTMWSLQGQVADKCVCGLVVLVWAAYSQPSRDMEVWAVSRSGSSDANCMNSGHYLDTNKSHGHSRLMGP